MANKRALDDDYLIEAEVNGKRGKSEINELDSDNSQYDEVDTIDDDEGGDMQDEDDAVNNPEEEEPYGTHQISNFDASFSYLTQSRCPRG